MSASGFKTKQCHTPRHQSNTEGTLPVSGGQTAAASCRRVCACVRLCDAATHDQKPPHSQSLFIKPFHDQKPGGPSSLAASPEQKQKAQQHGCSAHAALAAHGRAACVARAAYTHDQTALSKIVTLRPPARTEPAASKHAPPANAPTTRQNLPCALLAQPRQRGAVQCPLAMPQTTRILHLLALHACVPSAPACVLPHQHNAHTGSLQHHTAGSAKNVRAPQQQPMGR